MNSIESDVIGAVHVAKMLAQRICAVEVAEFSNVQSTAYEMLAFKITRQYRQVDIIRKAFENLLEAHGDI